MTEENLLKIKKQRSTLFPLLVFLGGASAAYYVVLRPQMLRWGTEKDEATRSFPGDEVILHPQLQLTAAIDIEAPAEVVWAWLAQMGRGGTGYYSFDRLTNNGISSANIIRTDLPRISPGMELDNGLRVLQVDPSESLVLGGFSRTGLFGVHFDVTSAYILQAVSENHTRLICRTRLYSYGLKGILYNIISEPLFFVQLFAQLVNLRIRAESSRFQIILSKEKSNGNIRMTSSN